MVWQFAPNGNAHLKGISISRAFQYICIWWEILLGDILEANLEIGSRVYMTGKGQVSLVTSFPAVVGAVMSAIRKESEKGITQAEMAESIGATVSTWSRIEAGETALTIEQLAQAADKLGVKPSEILNAAEEKIFKLKEIGVGIEAKRIANSAALAGVVPVIGSSLSGLIGPIGIVAGAAALGVSLFGKAIKDKE